MKSRKETNKKLTLRNQAVEDAFAPAAESWRCGEDATRETAHRNDWTMKTIKIFLASSDELQDDRNAFGNLVRRLDGIYEKRGVRIELFEWEDYDAAYNGVRKQDEYNEAIKASDMFLALFHTKAGKYTLEEFDVATEEFQEHAAPKVFIYCKDLQPGETESPELAEFKRKLFDEMGHYWCRYANRDTMQLHFVMQLQLVERDPAGGLKLEEGTVKVGSLPVARLDNVPFAAGNESYRKMREELEVLPGKIEKARARLEKSPDDEDLKDDLQEKIDRYNTLKEDFEHLQESLLDTAKRVARLQTEQVSDRMRQAIEAFEAGNLVLANTILEDVAREADSHMEQLEQSKALLLQADILDADYSIPVEERVERVKAIYEKANLWAQKCDYETGDYLNLLYNAVEFLRRYSLFDEALPLAEVLVKLSEEVSDNEAGPLNSYAYSLYGDIHNLMGNSPEALKYQLKAVEGWDLVEEDNRDEDWMAFKIELLHKVASSYTLMGEADKTLEAADLALHLIDSADGLDEQLRYYNMIIAAGGYRLKGNFDKEKDSLEAAEQIARRIWGDDVPEAPVNLYTELGRYHYEVGNYTLSLDYYEKALSIYERIIGPQTSSASQIKGFIGLTYFAEGEYAASEKALLEALHIAEVAVGKDSVPAALHMSTLSNMYYATGQWEKALQYNDGAISAIENALGRDHPGMVDAFMVRGYIMRSSGKLEDAKVCFNKALEIQLKASGKNHPNVGSANLSIGNILVDQGRIEEAKPYFFKALSLYEKTVGPNHLNTIMVGFSLARVYFVLSDYEHALELTEKCVRTYEENYSGPHLILASCYSLIGDIYLKTGEDEKAMHACEKGIAVMEETGVEDPQTAAATHLCYAQLLEKASQLENAQQHYNKALDVCLQYIGEVNPMTARAMMGVGKGLVYQGQFEEGLQQMENAMAVFGKLYRKESVDYAANMAVLGWGYLQKGDFGRAIRLLKQSEAIMKKRLPADNPDMITIRGQIDYCESQSGRSGFRSFLRVFNRKK